MYWSALYQFQSTFEVYHLSSRVRYTRVTPGMLHPGEYFFDGSTSVLYLNPLDPSHVQPGGNGQYPLLVTETELSPHYIECIAGESHAYEDYPYYEGQGFQSDDGTHGSIYERCVAILCDGRGFAINGAGGHHFEDCLAVANGRPDLIMPPQWGGDGTARRGRAGFFIGPVQDVTLNRVMSLSPADRRQTIGVQQAGAGTTMNDSVLVGNSSYGRTGVSGLGLGSGSGNTYHGNGALYDALGGETDLITSPANAAFLDRRAEVVLELYRSGASAVEMIAATRSPSPRLMGRRIRLLVKQGIPVPESN